MSSTPSHSTPRYVAARVRKLLAAKGWPLRKVTGRYQPFASRQTWTEGFYVHKVGVSKSVSIGYGSKYAHGTVDSLPRRLAHAKVSEAIAYLRDLGYRVDDRGWIECDAYDDHDR